MKFVTREAGEVRRDRVGLSGRLTSLKGDQAKEEVVGHMQTPVPLYKPIQDVIESASPRLILFSCPKEYGSGCKISS